MRIICNADRDEFVVVVAVLAWYSEKRIANIQMGCNTIMAKFSKADRLTRKKRNSRGKVM
jgi:hypothetical protein